MTLLLDRPITDVEAELTRRRFLSSGAVLGAGLLIGGCADDGPVAAGPSATPTWRTRTVRDVLGNVEVPGDPRRIVALDDQVLGNVLALGIEIDRIVGWARGDYGLENYSYLDRFGDLGRIENVGGTFDNPNIEGILRVRPDLMLMVGEDGVDFYTPIFDKLRQTGVPFFSPFNGYLTFDDYLRLLADVGIAVDRADKAAELAGAMRDRVDAVSASIAEPESLPSVAFLRVPGDGSLQNTTQPLLDALGFPGKRPTPAEFNLEVSPERLDLFDHDVLFVSDGGDEATTRKTLEENPLWERLPAVESGSVFFVREVLWGTSYSLPAVDAMLDEIEAALLSDNASAGPTATQGS